MCRHFNATGKDNLRIYEKPDAFQSRRPIDVISANQPILILDEPQKMDGPKTLNIWIQTLLRRKIPTTAISLSLKKATWSIA